MQLIREKIFNQSFVLVMAYLWGKGDNHLRNKIKLYRESMVNDIEKNTLKMSVRTLLSFRLRVKCKLATLNKYVRVYFSRIRCAWVIFML